MHLIRSSISAGFYRLACALFVALTLVAAPAYSMSHGGAAAPAVVGQANVQPLGSYLTPAGGLDTAGFTGSLDPRGYTMALGPGGAPRFVPTAAEPGDEHWDDRFGTPGVYNGDIEAVAAAPAGDLYVGGSFSQGLPGVAAKNIARWDGRRWYPLGEGVSGAGERVRGIVTHDSLVYVIGDFTSAGGVTAQQVARWDGQAWSAVGSGVGPRFQTDYGFDQGYIYAAAVAPNGDLYVGGYFNRIDDVEAHSVARWDGQQWHTLGAGVGSMGGYENSERFDAWVYALAAAADGSVYVGGKFGMAGDVSANSIARWDGGAWAALGDGLTIDNEFEPWGDVRAIAVGAGQVYAAGQFSQAGGAAAANIAVWNGSAWAALGAGLSVEFAYDSPVSALLLDGATLYAGGEFTRAGGANIAGLAQWSGGQWSAVGQGGEVVNDSNGAQVHALAHTPAGLFAAGQVEKAGERYVFGIALGWPGLGQPGRRRGQLRRLPILHPLDLGRRRRPGLCGRLDQPGRRHARRPGGDVGRPALARSGRRHQRRQ